MNKPLKLTPWQQWAQEYCSRPDSNIEFHVFGEDADRYAHAAWEECKRRCLEILDKDGSYGLEDVYKRIKKL